RILIRFDLSSVPAGAQIISATLGLALTKAGLGGPTTVAVTLHPLSHDWGEATSGDPSACSTTSGVPATDGDATWSHAHHPSDPWSSPGGDFDAASATALVGKTLGRVTWTVTADILAWL